ncbi:MAG: YveK family protein [Anaerostipes sp.]|uniref:YveK family protein n=1 Tax=Anaerostipes sp. TaxID=1872530 RepID=UPI00399255E1
MELQNDEIEIDLLDLCKYFLSKWNLILLGILLCAGVGLGYAKVRGVMEYTSTAKVYITVPKTSDKVLIRDNANELVADYVQLLKTELIVDQVAEQSGISKSAVNEALMAEQVEGARMILITVKTESREDTMAIAKEVLPAFQDVVTNTLKKDQPIVVEKVLKPNAAMSIDVKKTSAIGAAAGFVIVMGILFVLYSIKINREIRQ